MLRFISFLIVFISFESLWAALPPARFIVQELAKNSGSGVYQIEQDVQFPTNGEPLVLRETWWIANENSMRVEVTGMNELKNQFRLEYVYQNGHRFSPSSANRSEKKLNEDFIEKYFHYRSSDHLLSDLIAMKVLPPSVAAKKPVRLTKEADYRPENQVRLGRTGGVLAYIFGTPSPVEGNLLPGFWIEQDAFVLRKLRLPSTAEVTAEKFAQSPRGLLFPRQRTVRWNNNSVQIQTLSVISKTGLKADFFQPRFNSTSRLEGIENPAQKSLVEEFYMRFR